MVERGTEEGQALNMIPMEMRKEDMAFGGLLRGHNFVAELADARSGVKNKTASFFSDYFDAGGIAANSREEIIRQGREKKLSRLLTLDILTRYPLDRR